VAFQCWPRQTCPLATFRRLCVTALNCDLTRILLTILTVAFQCWPRQTCPLATFRRLCVTALNCGLTRILLTILTVAFQCWPRQTCPLATFRSLCVELRLTRILLTILTQCSVSTLDQAFLNGKSSPSQPLCVYFMRNSRIGRGSTVPRCCIDRKCKWKYQCLRLWLTAAGQVAGGALFEKFVVPSEHKEAF
jgi:hypothetical protein